jgi:hypothetical protein
MSHGTSASNAAAGVLRSRAAPAAPPNPVMLTSVMMRRPFPFSSGLDPRADPVVVPSMAVVLVTFAASGDNPTASNAG